MRGIAWTLPALWKGQVVNLVPSPPTFSLMFGPGPPVCNIISAILYEVVCFFSWVNKCASIWKEKQTKQNPYCILCCFSQQEQCELQCWVPIIREVLLFCQLLIGQLAILLDFLQMASSLTCALCSLPMTSAFIPIPLEERGLCGLSWMSK